MPSISNKNTERLEELFLLAEESGIPIDEDCPAEIASMSVKLPDGKMVIGLSDETEHSRLEKMAHEMGHCMTDSFYEGYSPFELREKHERRANEWAANTVIPFSELCRAVGLGYREVWELAEYFGVSEEFVLKAIAVHERNGHTVPKKLYSEAD